MDTDTVTTELQLVVEPAGELAIVQPRPADQDPVRVYLGRLREGSEKTMGECLDRAARIIARDESANRDVIPWGMMRFQHMEKLKAELLKRYSASYTNLHLSAVRGVLKQAWKLGQMTTDEYMMAKDVEGVHGGKRLPTGRHIKDRYILDMLDACPQSPMGTRDAAIIAVFFFCGLRRAELVALDLADFDRTTDPPRLVIRHGKGDKERDVPINNGQLDYLMDWVAERGEEPGPLFYGLGNRQTGKRMTPQNMYRVLQDKARAAGVDKFSPHSARRTFAGNMLDAGVDLVTLADLMGHSSVETTRRYDRRGERARNEAAGKLHVPYRSKRLPVKESPPPAEDEPAEDKPQGKTLVDIF